MSYCRWSSDNFRCDLYCYEHVNGGWTTHVAGWRYPDDPADLRPEPPDFFGVEKMTAEMAKEYCDASNALSEWCQKQSKTGKMVKIGGPYDGQSFNDETLEDFKERLLDLRANGYRFPDYVLRLVDEEIEAEADK